MKTLSDPRAQELKRQYFAARALVKQAVHDLSNFILEQSDVKVGDIIKYVPGPHSMCSKAEEFLVVSMHPTLTREEEGSDSLSFYVKAVTRRRLKSGGWHKTPVEQYDVHATPEYKSSSYWQVVGHEGLPKK